MSYIVEVRNIGGPLLSYAISLIRHSFFMASNNPYPSKTSADINVVHFRHIKDDL